MLAFLLVGGLARGDVPTGEATSWDQWPVATLPPPPRSPFYLESTAGSVCVFKVPYLYRTEDLKTWRRWAPDFSHVAGVQMFGDSALLMWGGEPREGDHFEDSSIAMRTDDKGRTWKEITPPGSFVDAIFFLTAARGFALTREWKEHIDVDAVTASIYDLREDREILPMPDDLDDTEKRVLVTDDGGRTWTKYEGTEQERLNLVALLAGLSNELGVFPGFLELVGWTGE